MGFTVKRAQLLKSSTDKFHCSAGKNSTGKSLAGKKLNW